MGNGGADNSRSLAGFEHTLVEQSRLRYVEADDGSARLDVDLVLLPGHPAYAPPSGRGRHGVVGGVITFSDADAVVLELSGRPPSVGADGTLALDHIDDWYVRDGHHHLAGTWGALDVWGGAVELEVDFPANYRVNFLPGRSGTGPEPIAFTGRDETGINEGRIVEVHTGRGTTWVGNVQPGWAGGSDVVLRTPDPDRFVLVVGRRAWYVDATRPEQFEILDRWVYGGRSVLRSELLLVEGELMLWGIDRDGVRWTTEDLGPTYGPVTVIEAGVAEAIVELIDIHTDRPRRSRISLADGHRIASA